MRQPPSQSIDSLRPIDPIFPYWYQEEWQKLYPSIFKLFSSIEDEDLPPFNQQFGPIYIHRSQFEYYNSQITKYNYQNEAGFLGQIEAAHIQGFQLGYNKVSEMTYSMRPYPISEYIFNVLIGKADDIEVLSFPPGELAFDIDSDLGIVDREGTKDYFIRCGVQAGAFYRAWQYVLEYPFDFESMFEELVTALDSIKEPNSDNRKVSPCINPTITIKSPQKCLGKLIYLLEGLGLYQRDEDFIESDDNFCKRVYEELGLNDEVVQFTDSVRKAKYKQVNERDKIAMVYFLSRTHLSGNQEVINKINSL